MMTLGHAMSVRMNNDFVWFVDANNEIMCGRIVNIVGVKEPPNTYIVHMDHIKRRPDSGIVAWTATRQLIDIYPTREDAIAGHIKRQALIYKNQIQNPIQLWQFMLSHDCINDQIARNVAIEMGEKFFNMPQSTERTGDA